MSVDQALESGRSAAAPFSIRAALRAAAPFALPTFIAFFLLLLTHARYGYFRDEMYYLACGNRLAWGYVDQPPLTPLISRLVETTLGTSLFDLRILPALAVATVAFLTCLMARRLKGGRLAVLLAGLCVALSPGFLAEGTFLSVNAFDLVIWATAQFLVLRWVQKRRPREWLWLGLVLGIGLLNKYTVALLGAGLLVGLLLTPHRRVLRTPWPWLGAAIATLLWAPNLWWQATHGWPTLEFLRNIRAEKNYPVNPIEFIAMQFAIIHPCIFPIAIVGWVALFRDTRRQSLRLFGWQFTTVFVILLIEQAKFYYLFPAYPIVFAAAGAATERWMAGRLRRIVPVLSIMIAGTAVTMPLAIPLLPIEVFERYNAALSLQHHIRFEKGRERKAPIIFADMFGWPEVTDAVAREYSALPAAERNRCVVLCANYGFASAIELLGADRRLPQPVSPHNNYYLWGPGDRPWSLVLALGYDADTLGQYFADVRPLDAVYNPLARESTVEINLCRRPRLTGDAILQRLKRFR